MGTILPEDCRLCGGPLTSIRSAPVCEACLERIEPMAGDENVCVRCGDLLAPESARMAGGWGEGQCAACRVAPPEFARAVAFAAYDRETREVLHLLKFAGMDTVAREVLAPGMAAAIAKLGGDEAREFLVVPVPLYRARQQRRGFNQAMLLAMGAIELLRRLRPAWELELAPRAMERVKDTHELYPLAPHQRRAGLRGAFRVAQKDVVHGRDVLLVDDILTTGATARECTRVLLAAGARSVVVATYARTLDQDAVRVAKWDAPATMGSIGTGGDGEAVEGLFDGRR